MQDLNPEDILKMVGHKYMGFFFSLSIRSFEYNISDNITLTKDFFASPFRIFPFSGVLCNKITQHLLP